MFIYYSLLSLLNSLGHVRVQELYESTVVIALFVSFFVWLFSIFYATQSSQTVGDRHGGLDPRQENR
jgi:hypothetical protein